MAGNESKMTGVDTRRRRLLAAAGFLGIAGGGGVCWLASGGVCGPVRVEWSRRTATPGDRVTLRVTRGTLPIGRSAMLRIWVMDLLRPPMAPTLMAEHALAFDDDVWSVSYLVPYPYDVLDDADLRFVATVEGVASSPLAMHVQRYLFSC